MKISIESLIRQPNGTMPVYLLLNRESVQDPILKDSLDGAMVLEGSLENKGQGVIRFCGTLQAKFSVPCDRCTQKTQVSLAIDLQEQFRKELTSEDWSFEREDYGYAHDEIDLSSMINDNILLHWPAKVLCSEHCKGLCPVCGCDRNTTHCSCREQQMDENPFSKLQALLCDDEEV